MLPNVARAKEILGDCTLMDLREIQKLIDERKQICIEADNKWQRERREVE